MIKFLRLPLLLIESIMNYLTLVRGRVTYQTYPTMYGFLTLNNNGICSMGSNLIFRNNCRSNLVGITKPCSLSIEENAKLLIGNNVGLSGTTIYCAVSITIGNFVNFGGNVCVWDTDFHPIDFIQRRNHQIEAINSSPIIIEDDVFIGANAVVLKGVTIGARSIIGANSVVSRNIPQDEIWAGNPAKFVKSITDHTKTPEL